MTETERMVIPAFPSEAEEAAWWDGHRDLVEERFLQAAAAGTLGRGRAANPDPVRVVNQAIENAVGHGRITVRIRQRAAAEERKRRSGRAPSMATHSYREKPNPDREYRESVQMSLRCSTFPVLAPRCSAGTPILSSNVSHKFICEVSSG